MWDPSDDGVTHVNVYSKAKTALGRWMSNWAEELIPTEDGDFLTIEGYWYWLGCRDERLRTTSGWPSKQLGRELERTHKVEHEEFMRKIKHALTVKMSVRPDMREAMKEIALPFTHYYVYGGKPKSAGAQWVIEHWEELRKY